MTKDEIKAYAQELIDIAKIEGDDPNSRELRTRIVQQVVAVCGMPFANADEHARAVNLGARSLRGLN